ncbi:MAG: hypothetical protein J6C50_02245 [Rickettsiales bacterium]|nr:hypothetical protein [Rickettsiales bacterium]
MSNGTTNSGIHTPKGGARSRTKNGEPAERSSTNSNKPVHPPVTGAKIRSGQNLQTKVSGGLSLEKFKKQQEQKKK